MLTTRDALKQSVSEDQLHDAALFAISTRESMLEKAAGIGVLRTKDEDIRSLREMITYGLKGIAAYTEHAFNLGKEDKEIYSFVFESAGRNAG